MSPSGSQSAATASNMKIINQYILLLSK